MSEAALEGRGIVRTFASGESTLDVLTGTDVRVEPGEIVAIIGPSGSGKSTLLHCLGGLDRPDDGVVRVAGRDLWGLSDRERSRLRSSIKRFRQALAEGDVEQARTLLPGTLSMIDKTAKTHAIHANAADRTKSRLTRALNRTASSAS